MNKSYLLLLVIAQGFGMFCNYYPLDEQACIHNTTGIQCQFNFFFNSCTETKSTKLGCSPTLNQDACLMQRTNSDQTEAKCYFGQKCLNVNVFHLKKLNCDQNFSFSACLNLVSKECQWIGNKCRTFNNEIIVEESCSQVYQSPVSPLLCSKIPSLKCYNKGFEGGYVCSDITDQQFTQFTCNTLGLSEMACVSIQTKGQKCIFQGQCQLYSGQTIDSCEMSLNKELCLGIEDLKCKWTNQGCVSVIRITSCDQINVNPSVCAYASGLCQYNELKSQCQIVSDIKSLTCDSKGLNIEACLQIKSQKCIICDYLGIFLDFHCRKVSEEELNLFSCEQLLNELACISLKTPSQFCKWDGAMCSRIFINQDTECPLIQDPLFPFKVNGNTCQAISKQNQGCKYNSITNLCQANTSITDTCTTSYLNFSGCVQIQSNIACQWSTETFSCLEIIIQDQLTKCNELGFANPIACSQVSEPLVEGVGLGCYYDSWTQTCKYTNDEVLINMECTQPGLNKYGCTEINKIGQRCRWVRGTCTSILKKESISLIPCLNLQFVNPGTCALATANQEVCKYNRRAMGCVNTLNSSEDGDSCDTPGLNSYACSQITRNPQGCYFDMSNNICVLAPNSASSDQAEKYASYQLLSSAHCIASSPTKNICIAIITEGELCTWNSRSNSCEYQYIEFNEKCLDYNTIEKQKTQPGATISINANVCSRILMSYPDSDPNDKTSDKLRGYCQYDGSGNCIIYSQQPCSDNCCTQVSGINAHVCSRFTNPQAYCYFNENNKCVELTNSDTDMSDPIKKYANVKAFYNYKQYKCSSMNRLSCTMIDWSPRQQCYWNGSVCTQIDFNNYSDYFEFRETTNLSKYACLAITATLKNGSKYFRLSPDQKVCNYFWGVIMSTCDQYIVNQNVCLGSTPYSYCQWDKINLQCLTIDNFLNLKTCNEYQNKKACIENPYMPCLFLNSADKCIPSPQEVNCDDFGNVNNQFYGWVNQKACSNITKAGQICQFYNYGCSITYATSQSCDLPGINSIGCYSKTTGNCRWDAEQLLCYEVDISEELQCTDNVNKSICLSLITYPCEWSTVDLKCSNKASFLTINPSNLYNTQTCTQMIGAAYYYDANSQMCKVLTTTNNDCTTYIMNQQACLLNTKGYRCFFDPTQPPEQKCQQFMSEQEVCSSDILINIEICMNIPKVCYFDESTLQCSSTTIGSSLKCSSLVSDTVHYNKLACSSIGYSVNDASQDAQQVCTNTPSVQNAAQQCYFEKYCYWRDYGCQLYQIVSASFSWGNQDYPASCSLSPIRIPSCTPIYSAAVCLQFGNGCFFDLAQGGCKPYTQNLFKVTSCSQINGDDCSDSKTAKAYCMKVLSDGTDLTDNCSIDPPITSTCTKDTNFIKSACSTLLSSTSALDCVQASDDCFFKTTCSIPTSSDVLTCTTPGVSQSLCLSLMNCDFSSGKCTNLTIPSLGLDNYYYVCNEVNLLTTNASAMACGSITTSPCKYQGLSCGNAFYQTCSSLSGLIVSQLACNQCLGATTVYNPDTFKCEVVTNLTSDCDSITGSTACQAKTQQCQWDSENNKCHINALRLNKLSCLQLTQLILCKWDSNTSQCIVQSTSIVKQETDCTIQGVKSCLLIKNTCWISSTTNQCVQLNSLKISCLSINQASGSQNQCLISGEEACKWVNNQCVSANLLTDSCSVFNKFGCIHVQQNVNCGWSDKYTQCKQVYIYQNSGCSRYVNGGDSNYNQVNPYSCSLIQNSNCYWNNLTNKCISVGSTPISCLTNIGINQKACIQSTVGKCKFDTLTSTCLQISSTDTTCSSFMNKEACLSLPYCQFTTTGCSSFNYLSKITIADASAPPGQVISPYICTFYNDHIIDAYFIYDTTLGYCVNTNKANPSLYIAQCASIGVNEKICKQKTNQYCQYTDKCTEISQDLITSQTTCNSTFNWKSCLKLPVNCKFSGGQCVPILSDTCVTLSSVGVFVSAKVCAQMTTACSYNSVMQQCQQISDANQSCSTPGISQVGCISKTSQSQCLYDVSNAICMESYDRSKACSDINNSWYLNENLCYFVDSVGSYCYFANSLCQQLPDAQVKNCYLTTKTNARTCSKAQNSLCFYYSSTKSCIQDLGILQLQPWSNKSSFNKLSCISFDNLNDPRKTIWDDIKGCLELSTSDLQNIQCSSPVNRLGCVAITNPTQFCQYNVVTKQCIGFNYIIPPTVPISVCVTLTNVNRMEFCQYAPDSCQFNSLKRNCIIATITNAQILTASDCFDKGLSKIACSNLTLCKYSDARKLCYGGNVFCSDNTPDSCSTVITEPCWVRSNQCTGISYTDLGIVKCSDVVNQLGCTSITTASVVCQFDQLNVICKEITNFTNNCSSYTNVNSALACEQTIDVACKFDYSSKACKAVVYSDVFECDRGLNQIACTEYTRSSLGCKFGKFCYGPTYGVSQCSDMINIGTCMNYQFQCTWDSGNCVDFLLNGQKCIDLQNSKTVVSSQVCYNSYVDQGVCLYDTNTNNCKLVIPKTCQELETQQQCISQSDLPCLWNNDRCSFVTLLPTDLCSYIGDNGTKRACLDVFRQGEQCQYRDKKCQSYIDSQSCLDSINLIACVQQFRSKCQWKITTTKVMVNLKDEQTYNYGTCVDYVMSDQQGCDKSLSYLSCFTVTKSGQFCRWSNGQCMTILQQQSTTKIYYNTFSLINSNSCGLVNQGKVRYSEITKSCILITNDHLTCKCGSETIGMNKYACLSILNENCIWNDTTKRCLEYESPCYRQLGNRI